MSRMCGGRVGRADASASFIAVGIHRYDRAEPRVLEGVERDVDAMARLLTDLGFTRTQADLDTNATVDDVRRALHCWKDHEAERTVVYWAGHAVVRGDELALLFKGSDPDSWTPSSALPVSELAMYIAPARTKEVLLILDTCHAGGAAAGLFQRLWPAMDVRSGPQRRVWLLAAASAASTTVEDASGGRLVPALDRLIRAGAPTTATAYWTESDEHIRIEDLSRALEELGAALGVRPELSGRQPLSRNFLRNLGHRSAVPQQTVDEARERRLRWAALDRDEAESHFWPSSRGVEVREDGWHFTGRRRVLSRIVEWLHSGGGPQLVVVTGSPGAGKSALLGRLATLSDPAYRRLAESEGALTDAPPETIPRLGAIRLSILLRGLTLDLALRRVAAGFLFEIPPERRAVPADVLESLADRISPRDVVMLDALDEAADPRSIAAFVRQLAGRCRVLLGTRRNLGRGSGLGPDDLGPLLETLHAAPANVVVLDHDEDAGNDIEGYVRRLLTHPPASCAYRWDLSATDAVAEAIAEHANGVFRLAHDWCRVLCQQPEAFAPGSGPFQQLLRLGSSGVFSVELARFGSDAHRARELLTALAWSRGLGLPRVGIWPAVATAVAGLPGGSGRRYGQTDVIWVLEQAGALIVEAGEHERTVYRLYHQEFADYLRETTTGDD
jgi:hypothetical protein